MWFCVCKLECIRPLTINTQSFTGKSRLCCATNAVQAVHQSISPRRPRHFNYTFDQVNSANFVNARYFFLYSFIFTCTRFLTGSPVGTFCSNRWYALLDNRSFTDQTYVSVYVPFRDCWSRPDTRTKEETLTNLVLVQLTTFLFIQHFVCVSSTNVIFYLLLRFEFWWILIFAPLLVINTIL